MAPPHSYEDPYSQEAQQQLKITNLRVQLLKRQACPCQNVGLGDKPQHFAHYAIYDFIVKGSCFCNGHADHCVEYDGFRKVHASGALHMMWHYIFFVFNITLSVEDKYIEKPIKKYCHHTTSVPVYIQKRACYTSCAKSCVIGYGVCCATEGTCALPKRCVHGRCMCKHNTAGEHCQHCASLYNDQPWRAANGKTGAPHECKKCKCNGHADRCHFSIDVWLASGNRSGGVCDECQHNTEGQHCQRCKAGFHRDLRRPFSAPDACKPCSCHLVGTASPPFSNSTLCDSSNGDCPCKPGVAGPVCDKCMVGYWGFGEYGCRPCDCAGSCDPLTGDCITSHADIDWYREIPDFHPVFNESEPTWDWEDEQGFSALRHSGKCECKEQVLGNPKLFCAMQYSFVVKVKILSAHDKGSHAEVNVKIKKVLKMTKLKILRGKRILYPESWTNRGCTCPILNPGLEYLVAGYEDFKNGRLIVNMKSFVHLWKPTLGRKVLEILKSTCI